MLRKMVLGARQPWQMIAQRCCSKTAAAVNPMLLHSLKEHYLRLTRMSPPPRIKPPSPFTIVKNSLEIGGPVLKRTYHKEEIDIYVMRFADLINVRHLDNDGHRDLLFLHVTVSKPDEGDALHFLCDLYPDAVGVRSVSLRPKLEALQPLKVPTEYHGPVFENLDIKMRDALHSYIEERGVSEELFEFLHAWLYVKDHRDFLHWFRTVGTMIKAPSQPHKP